jgi:hypothetical protein
MDSKRQARAPLFVELGAETRDRWSRSSRVGGLIQGAGSRAANFSKSEVGSCTSARTRLPANRIKGRALFNSRAYWYWQVSYTFLIFEISRVRGALSEVVMVPVMRTCLPL